MASTIRIRAAVTAAACVALLAACAGTGDSPGTTSTDAEIHIFTVGSMSNQAYSEPQLGDGANAAVDAINASGGINGRRLVLTLCDDQLSPNGAVTCARQAVKEKVAAVVSAGEYVSNDFFEILHDAGIPVIGNVGALPAEYTLDNSFMLDGGLPAWRYGQVAALVKMGASKPAVVQCDTASCALGTQIAEQAFAIAGITDITVATLPLTTPDATSAVTAALSGGTDSILISGTKEQVPPIVVAARQAGFQGPIIAISGADQTSIVKALGANTQNFYMTTFYPSVADSQDPGVARFLADINAHKNNAPPDQLTMHAWVGVQAFAELAKRLDVVDAKTVMAGMSAITCTEPLEVPLTRSYCTQPFTAPLQEYPRVVNLQVNTLGIANGVAKATEPPFDPLQYLREKKGA